MYLKTWTRCEVFSKPSKKILLKNIIKENNVHCASHHKQAPQELFRERKGLAWCPVGVQATTRYFARGKESICAKVHLKRSESQAKQIKGQTFQ